VLVLDAIKAASKLDDLEQGIAVRLPLPTSETPKQSLYAASNSQPHPTKKRMLNKERILT
jgi:hypothetical protein